MSNFVPEFDEIRLFQEAFIHLEKIPFEEYDLSNKQHHENRKVHAKTRSEGPKISSEPRLETRAPKLLRGVFAPVKKVMDTIEKQAKQQMKQQLLNQLSTTSPTRMRQLLTDKRFRPIVEKMVREPKHEIPDNFHDDVGGVFLRILMSYDDGPLVLEMIELVRKNVRVVSTEERTDYYINMFKLMTAGGKRYFGEDSEMFRQKLYKVRASIPRRSDTITSDKNSEPSMSSTLLKYPRRSYRSIKKYASVKKPENFHDCAKGLLLRIVLSRREGPLFLNMIKAIGNNVRIVREDGKKPQYYIDFLGLAASPGMSHLTSDVPGIPGEMLRSLSKKQPSIPPR